MTEAFARLWREFCRADRDMERLRIAHLIELELRR